MLLCAEEGGDSDEEASTSDEGDLEKENARPAQRRALLQLLHSALCACAALAHPRNPHRSSCCDISASLAPPLAVDGRGLSSCMHSNMGLPLEARPAACGTSRSPRSSMWQACGNCLILCNQTPGHDLQAAAVVGRGAHGRSGGASAEARGGSAPNP